MKQSPSGPASEQTPALLCAEGLSVRRDGRVVLSAVDVDIAAGECVAVVGPNGAGKTSLLLALLGLLPASSGEVRLRGRPLRRCGGRRAIARELAYVAQTYEGFAGFRVEDMVATGRYAHCGPLGLHGDRDRAVIEQSMAACGLSDLRERVVSQLSGGERQKVHLAAAMAQESPALLLDEPTAALDARHQAALLRTLRELLVGGRTLVVVCHDLNVAAALRARIVALRDGCVRFDGDLSAFLDPGRLREIFDTEFERIAHPDGPRVLPRL